MTIDDMIIIAIAKTIHSQEATFGGTGDEVHDCDSDGLPLLQAFELVQVLDCCPLEQEL